MDSLFDFDRETKLKILARDGYKCVVCGRGKEDGVELTVDHKIPKDKGGDNSVENGQTLCMEHNLLKKNYSRTEAGKRYFIQLYEDAKKINDERMIMFCKSIFDVFDLYRIDLHIKRPDIKFALRKRQRRRMELAAQILQQDYRSDPELTAFTALDGEEVQEAA